MKIKPGIIKLLTRSLFIIIPFFTMAQKNEVIPLYNSKIPNSINHPDEEFSETTQDSILLVHKISRPLLTVYKPSVSNGTAVIICPGGGYWIEAAGHEGGDVAKKLNDMQITAF